MRLPVTSLTEESLRAMLYWHNVGVRTAIEELTLIKENLDRALLSGDFSACDFAAVEFLGPLCLATTGTLTPDIDLEGQRLQHLHDLSRASEWLSVAVDVTPAGGAVVFSWLRDASGPRRFVESLLARPSTELPQILAQLLLFYLENTYFSYSWWSELADKDQTHLRSLATEPNPYYAERRFLSRPFLPWRLKRVHPPGAA